jgi:hypothetical protein
MGGPADPYASGASWDRSEVDIGEQPSCDDAMWPQHLRINTVEGRKFNDYGRGRRSGAEIRMARSGSTTDPVLRPLSGLTRTFANRPGPLLILLLSDEFLPDPHHERFWRRRAAAGIRRGPSVAVRKVEYCWNCRCRFDRNRNRINQQRQERGL